MRHGKQAPALRGSLKKGKCMDFFNHMDDSTKGWVTFWVGFCVIVISVLFFKAIGNTVNSITNKPVPNSFKSCSLACNPNNMKLIDVKKQICECNIPLKTPYDYKSCKASCGKNPVKSVDVINKKCICAIKVKTEEYIGVPR